MKLKPLLLLLFYFFLQLISIEVNANEDKFILKNEAGKLIFEIEIPENHIIYGIYQGALGLPTKIDLKLSTNLKKHQLLWPIPQEKKSSSGRIIHFYKNKLEVPLILEPIDEKKSAELEFDIAYVMCGEQCELIKDNISIELSPEFWEEANHYNRPLVMGREQGDPVHPRKISIETEEPDSPVSLGHPLHDLIPLLIMALLGGFILNFMPCVLPVLSLKIISFIRHPEIDRKKASLSTIAGIISSFWVLGLIAISFKNAGKHFGLGANFQDPLFIIALILIITFFISIALERISFNTPYSIYNFVSNLKIRGQYLENYFSGILATILSTPCNAPFLGSALFLSLQQSNLFIFLTFSMIGLGFSLPYIAIIAWPSSLRLIPKPGKWMHYLKLTLVIMLICTVFWLLTILQAQINTRATIGLFFLLLLMKFILENNEFIFKYFYVKVLGLAMVIILSFLLPEYSYNESQQQQIKIDNLWQKFEPEKIDSLVSEGKIVFVDITADWCITCKYNKYFVLNREKIMQILSGQNIVAIRGDFTNYAPEIHNFLVKRKMRAIPYNVVFGPSSPGGIDLPVILSRSIIEEGVEGAR